MRCWKQPDAAWRSYDKVLISRMQVTLKPGQGKHVDPSDLKMLFDYFHGALVAALKPSMEIVDKPGPGVLVLRITEPDRPRPFKVPFVWPVALLSTAACLFIMVGLPRQAWERFFLWLVIGILIYVFYGYRHSRLRQPS